MALTLKILGLFLLVGGLAATGLGWPYRMIDWGNIQVILGGVSSACGLILAAVGVVLAEVRHLRQVIDARNSPLPDESTGAAATARMEPQLESPSPDVSQPSALPAPAIAVAAAVAGAAGAAALATHGVNEPGTIAVDAPESVPALDIDRTLSPDHVPDSMKDDRFSAGSLTDISEDGLVWIKPDDRPAGLSVDALTEKINEAAGDLTALRREIIDAGHGEAPQAVVESSQEPVPESEPEMIPVEATEPEGDVLLPGISDEAHGSDLPDQVPEAEADRSVAYTEEPHPEPALHNDESQPDPQPAANAEGVVSVHTVGDATFTMYSDGTIRADTPDGAFGFSTVADLKAYLAGDRTVARPLG